MDNNHIINFIKKYGGNEFNNNFLGVYPVDKLTDIIKDIEQKTYPFCIFNTDPVNKPGTHWCATHILNNMDRPSFFIFDSFGKLGLQTFFIEQDYNILRLFITNFKESIRTLINDTPTFDYFKWTIHCDKYIQLNDKIKNELSETCKGFMNLLMSYLKYNN